MARSPNDPIFSRLRAKVLRASKRYHYWPSHALCRRLPDELMDLQTQAYVQSIREDPLRQLPGIEQAVRGVALQARRLCERRREDHAGNPILQPVPAAKVAGELVVGAV